MFQESVGSGRVDRLRIIMLEYEIGSQLVGQLQ